MGEINVRETARRLNVSEGTVRNYSRNGTLPPSSRTAGGFARFDEDDVEELRLTLIGARVRSVFSDAMNGPPELAAVDPKLASTWEALVTRNGQLSTALARFEKAKTAYLAALAKAEETADREQ